MLAFPKPPNVDDLYPDPPVEGMPQWRWDGSRWIAAGGTSGAGGIDEAPSDGRVYGRTDGDWQEVVSTEGGAPMTGPLVLAGDPVDPLDAATKQYVDHEVEEVASAGGGAAFEPDTTGDGDVFVLQDEPTINHPRIMGVTDGSNAQPGEIGEIVKNEVTSAPTAASFVLQGTLPLTAGDWQVELHGFVQLRPASPDNGPDFVTKGNGQIRLWSPPSEDFAAGVVAHSAFSGMRDAINQAVFSTVATRLVTLLRFNRAAPFTITASLDAYFASPNPATTTGQQATFTMIARRMR